MANKSISERITDGITQVTSPSGNEAVPLSESATDKYALLSTILDHTKHTSIGTNTHAQIDTALTASTNHIAGDGSDHADVASNTAASHAEAHTVASHSDTTATGAELETLTDGSDADALHAHATNDGLSHAESHTVASHSDTTATGAELDELTDGSTTTLHAHAAGDHGGLTGLTDDDHTQYALLAGRSGGQTIQGDTASGGDLTLESTSNATKGLIVANDPIKFPVTGTGRSSKIQAADAGINNFASVSILSDESETNQGIAMAVIPRGTGFNANIKSQVSVFNTDFIADNANYEAFVFRAGGSTNGFILATTAVGTGVDRPVSFRNAGATTLLKIDNLNSEVNLPNLTNYANDAAAGSAGLVSGDLYTTTSGSEITLKVKS